MTNPCPQHIGHSLLPLRQRMRFKHKDCPLMLQLGSNVFTVNILPNYQGWNSMLQDVLGAWRQVRDALKPAKITRIGLCYINKLTVTDINETPGKWFKTSDYLPEAVLRSKGSFFSRVESQVDGENRIIISFAEAQSDGRGPGKGIIFDIDRILQKRLMYERISNDFCKTGKPIS